MKQDEMIAGMLAQTTRANGTQTLTTAQATHLVQDQHDFFTKPKRISVGRPINGISINPLEYLLDDDGTVMLFADENEAKNYLLSKGYEPEYIYWMSYSSH